MSTSSPHVLFRWSDFRGQINYGDRPPPDAQNIIKIDLMTIGENTQSLLPYLVRRAASNFPVMLFTSKNCPPCGSAREFLTKRGVPFAERTIESADDSMEFKRLTGADAPVVRYMRRQPDTEALLRRVQGLLGFLLPRVRREGKRYLTIAIGCTGGRHRSVMLANELGRRLREDGANVRVRHRDVRL